MKIIIIIEVDFLLNCNKKIKKINLIITPLYHFKRGDWMANAIGYHLLMQGLNFVKTFMWSMVYVDHIINVGHKMIF